MLRKTLRYKSDKWNWYTTASGMQVCHINGVGISVVMKGKNNVIS